MAQPLMLHDGELADTTHIDRIDRVDARVDELERRLAQVEAEYSTVKKQAVGILLATLAQAVRQIAGGEVDLAEPDTATVTSTGTGTGSKWDFWKRRFPGRISDTIDLLLHQKAMNSSQLCAALKCDPRTLSAKVIYPLNKAGLIIKNGNNYSLKEI